MNAKERFLRYVAFDTTSDALSEDAPSTSRQLTLAAELEKELLALGAQDVVHDGTGYVYARVPGTPDHDGEAPLGFLAHIDTSPDVPGEGVVPYETVYDGVSAVLPGGEIVTTAAYPELEKYKGREMIFSDGTTLLGADDKAGVAAVMTLCEKLLSPDAPPHCEVFVCFTPDEETGRGTERFDPDRFRAPCAYTVDGGELGEIEYECFNAASAVVSVTGKNIHPGSAKGRMKNAVLIGTEFIGLLPRFEAPRYTEGYEGFYHVSRFTGSESSAEIRLIVRDHDRKLFEEKKRRLDVIAGHLNEQWGDGTVTVTLRDTYYNMGEIIKDHMFLIDRAREAFRACGIEPRTVPIRGGTDGAALSFRGLPCPNLSTGGLNFHSLHECIPADAPDTMAEVLLKLCL